MLYFNGLLKRKKTWSFFANMLNSFFVKSDNVFSGSYSQIPVALYVDLIFSLLKDIFNVFWKIDETFFYSY